jgi:hypothetical protein
MDQQDQRNAIPLRQANGSVALFLERVEMNAAGTISELIKAGVSENILKAEIRKAVMMLRFRLVKNTFFQMWGMADRRSLTQLIADLRLRADQLERIGKSVEGSRMIHQFSWLDRSVGRRDWKILEQTKTAIPEILRAYASSIETCDRDFQLMERVMWLPEEDIIERRLVRLVTDATGSPHWISVSALLFWVYEATGAKRKTSEEAVRKRYSRPLPKLPEMPADFGRFGL